MTLANAVERSVSFAVTYDAPVPPAAAIASVSAVRPPMKLTVWTFTLQVLPPTVTPVP